MLTREEAKTKDCPHFYNHETKTYRKCVAEDCPKWRDSEDIFIWCAGLFACGDEGGINIKAKIDTIIIPESFIKQGNECLVLTQYNECVLDDTDGDLNKNEFDFCGELHLKSYLKDFCNKCPHRFGYCGS